MGLIQRQTGVVLLSLHYVVGRSYSQRTELQFLRTLWSWLMAVVINGILQLS